MRAKRFALACLAKFGAGVFTVFLLLSGFAHAYEPTSTHAALSDEMADFYNLFVFNENDKITSEEKEWIVTGTIEEDAPPRWVNHFYDPIYNRGWLGIAASSKEWAQSALRESLFFLTTEGLASITFWQSIDVSSDYTWGRGIKDFVRGDKKRSMEVLGHVLHLIEDATVPEHTRNDTHISAKDTYGIVQHAESPYEGWATWHTRETLHISNALKDVGLTPMQLDALDTYFDEVAMYTNTHFFSEDTITSGEYSFPKIAGQEVSESGELFGYGVDEDGSKFELVKLGVRNQRNLLDIVNVTLYDDTDTILNNYFSRLSKKSVIYGAGIIKLYFDEIKKAQQKEAERMAKLNAWFASMVGVWDSTWGAIDSFLGLPGFGESYSYQGANIVDIVNQTFPSPTPSYSTTPSPTSTPEPTVLGESDVEEGDPTPTPLSLPSVSVSPSVYPGVLPSLSPSVSPASTPVPSTAYLGGSGTDIPLQTPAPPTPEPSETPELSPTPSPEPTPIPDTTPPTFSFDIAPKEIASRTVELVWSSNDSDTESYDLEFSYVDYGDSATATRAWAALFADANATSAVFTAPHGEATYFFRLRARDTSGNTSEWQERTADVSDKPVVINEVAWMGTEASFQDEWMELANKTNTVLSVSGWTVRITTLPGTVRNIMLVGNIEPHGYYLMERTDDTVVSDVPADLVFVGATNNTDARIALLDASGAEIDTTPHGSTYWAAGDNERKASMERVRMEVPGGDPYNWYTNNGRIINGLNATSTPIVGTPRAQNSVANAYTSAHGQQFLAADAIWYASRSPYYIPISMRVNSGHALTLEQGVTVKFGYDATMSIEGLIRANGTIDAPVVFTAFDDDIYGGDTNQDATSTTPTIPFWKRIEILPTSAGSEFHHTVFRYGGMRSSGVYDVSAPVVSVENTSALLDHAVFETGGKTGLRLINSSSAVRNSSFYGFTEQVISGSCEQLGGQAILVSRGSPIIERNVIDGAYYGMWFCSATPVVRNNTLRNTYIPVSLESSLGEFRGNTIEASGEYGIRITGAIAQSGTLTRDTVPYIAENIFQDLGSVLTIEPGVIFKIGSGSYPMLTFTGSVYANGTAQEPIIFTAYNDDTAGGDTNNDATSTLPLPGAWHALVFSPSSVAEFSHVRVRYGGGPRNGVHTTWTAMDARSPSLLTFDHVKISDSAAHGFMLANAATGTVVFTNAIFARNSAYIKAGLHLTNATPTLTDTAFLHNYFGIFADTLSHPVATNVTFENNAVDTEPVDLLGP